MDSKKDEKRPYITREDIEREIANECYFTAADGIRGAAITGAFAAEYLPELGLTTFCVLVLRSGFVVTGMNTCVRAEAFDVNDGRQKARAHAMEKLTGHVLYAWKRSR